MLEFRSENLPNWTVCRGGFLKIIPIGVPTYAGMKTGFYADFRPRNRLSCRHESTGTGYPNRPGEKCENVKMAVICEKVRVIMTCKYRSLHRKIPKYRAMYYIKSELGTWGIFKVPISLKPIPRILFLHLFII